MEKMLDMKQAGIATMAVGVAFLAVAGGTIGGPLAVDQLDTQPDSSIYALERAGESIKKPVLDGQSWEIERGEERTEEFTNMVNKGKAKEYSPLLSEAENHFVRGAKFSEDNEDLNKAMRAVEKHLNVLKNLENEVPTEARPAISLAREQSSRCLKVLENTSREVHPSGKISEEAKESLQTKITEIKENIAKKQKQIKKEIKKSTKKGETIDNIIKDIENRIGETDKEKHEKKEITATGRLEKLKDNLNYGTHAIMEEKQPKYALESKKIDLNKYIGKKVKTEGLKIHSGLNGGPPLVRVSKISILQKNSDKTDQKPEENKGVEDNFVPDEGKRK